ncbi:MAG: adenine phosphoribosyltransferase [Bacteroidetes bacterium]|nr:adenine phosphoribosyltransferase [Bacteroidota bacterium]
MLDLLKATVRTIPDFPKPGIQFKDITPVLADPKLLKLAVIALAEPWKDARITKVIGIESRGFILGAMLAERLGAGFVPVRKEGKLPFSTLKESYGLEYGIDTIEMHTDALDESDIVLIHDDVIATGGTAAAAQRLAESAGAQIAGYSFLINLTFLDGQSKLKPGLTCHSLIQY